MPDILIRNFPAEDLARLDELAARMRISRVEFLRRQLQQEARRSSASVTAADLVNLSPGIQDLDDSTVMGDAWS